MWGREGESRGEKEVAQASKQSKARMMACNKTLHTEECGEFLVDFSHD